MSTFGRSAPRYGPRRWRRTVRWIAITTAVVVALTVATPGVRRAPDQDPFPLSWLRGLLPAPLAWGAPAPTTPVQPGGTAAGKGHYVPTAATRAAHGKGRPPGKGAGQLPDYRPHAPAAAQKKTPPARGDQSYNAKTSTRIPSAASAASDVYRNADGSYTRRVYQAPVNYRATDGSWQPVDTTLAKGADGRLREKANGWVVDFAPTGTDQALVSLRADAGHAVAYGVRGAAAVAPTFSGSTVTYPGLLPDTDLRLSAYPAEVKESLVLRSASAPTSWVFPLRLNGLTPRLAGDGSVEFRDAGDRLVTTVPPGTMNDSAYDPYSGEPANSRAVGYKLSTVDGVPALVLSADPAWLHDPSRVYPVTVDPTFDEYPTGSTYAETTNRATTPVPRS